MRTIRNYIKMLIQEVILPIIYRIDCIFNKTIDDQLVVFADAHNTKLPFSMRAMYQKFIDEGYSPTLHLYDYSNSGVKALLYSIRFMKLYSKAHYVIICDNFLPVASCKKRSETKVIQLWHACGFLKKFGYDTPNDIPAYYKANVFKNYNLVTTSSPNCIQYYESAMKQPHGIVDATGISRTDLYFDENWRNEQRNNFYQYYPKAKGKKIVIWAPTFIKDVDSSESTVIAQVNNFISQFNDEWFVIVKLHPHTEIKLNQDFSTSGLDTHFCTEELLPIADVLVTDFSSICMDTLILHKPIVLYSENISDYLNSRGFYDDYWKLCPYITEKSTEINELVQQAYRNFELDYVNNYTNIVNKHCSQCDGNSTNRIYNKITLT